MFRLECDSGSAQKANAPQFRKNHPFSCWAFSPGLPTDYTVTLMNRFIQLQAYHSY